MKRAVILHSTNANPESHWFPWLKAELESRGYQVWVPELPANNTPNRHVYNDFLFGTDWDFTDNLVVGHSSGAVSILNLLADEHCLPIKTGVLVGAWARMEETDLDHQQFKDLFPPDGFDFDLIKQKVNRLLFIHGGDDPTCPLDQAKWLAQQTNGDLVIIPNGGHLSQRFGFTELPQLTKALEDRGWL